MMCKVLVCVILRPMPSVKCSLREEIGEAPGVCSLLIDLSLSAVMVAISDSLAWELVKRNNSFMRKKNGQTRRSGAVTFSIERGNLMSKSSYKYSGLANSKSIDITATPDNRAALTKKTKKAASSGKSGNAVIALNKDFRRVENTIKSQATDNYYRPDLKSEALAKYTVVYRANRAAKGVKKAVPIKRGRA
eukprot:CCRYP_007728-RB/>CCRYP_007728-RB protein AED:0.37 eAED:0.40 QI:1900/0.33/0.5/1/0.66/0.5/4/0/190